VHVVTHSGGYKIGIQPQQKERAAQVCGNLFVQAIANIDALRAKGVAFHTLVVDVFGSAHREFQDTIHHIARLRASATGESMVAQLFQRVSFALHRAVGACIVARSDLFAQ
jgi:hypothetical protein